MVTSRAFRRAGGRGAAAPPDRVPTTGSTRITTAIAVAATAVVAAEWLIPTLSSYDTGIRTFDSLYYHLPWAATFAQTGHVTALQYDIQYHLQFYPAGAELLHGLGIVLLGRDTLSPALNLMWLGLILLAAWRIGRSRGVAPLTMLGAIVALATPMIRFSQAGSADNDVVGVFFLFAAVALLLEAPDHRAAVILAAASCGIALGIKLTLAAPVLALTLGWIAIARAGMRRRTAVTWLVPLVLAGCFWYLRNLFSAGNPLPWASFGFLSTPAPALQQTTGYTVAHYLFDGRFWSHFFVSGVASQLGGWWWAVLACAIVGPLLCLGPRSDRVRRMLGFVALASLVAYLLTPEGAQGPAGDPVGFGFNMRYVIPGLTLSLAILPLAPIAAAPRRQVVLALALAAILIGTVAQGSLWAAHLAPAIIAAALIAAAMLTRPPIPRPVVALVALALVPAGYAWQRHYLRGRYAFQPGVSYLARVWSRFRTVHHARVGVVGTYGGVFSYPLYGLDLSNRVRYIAQTGPHGSFTPLPTCQAWRAAVNRARVSYLLTTPQRNFWQPRRLLPSPEGAWTRPDPAARLIYRRRVSGQEVELFELRGPLQPATCA
jgi:hypothetical protein